MANPVSTYRGRAKFKQRWADAWQTLPGCYPVRCLRGCAPIEQSADFIFEYGDIKRENATTFSVEAPIDLRDWYVKIELYDPADSSVNKAHWYGVVVSVTKSDQGGITATPTGTQTIQAAGLEHLLDRVKIANAKAATYTDDLDAPPLTVDIEWTPSFNVRYKRGHRIKGNRSSQPGEDGYYLISSNYKDEVWNNQQIADYLLHYFAPEAFPWKLAGQHEALTELEEVHKSDGQKSLWDWLNILIDRRRGLGFWLNVNPNDEQAGVEIVVFTLTNTPITVGPRTLPANDQQITFTIPGTLPEDHLVEPIQFTKTTAAVYDVVEARGERMMIAMSASSTPGEPDDFLFEHGSFLEKLNYHTATDAERSADKYENIWSQYGAHHRLGIETVNRIFGFACGEAPRLVCDFDGNVETRADEVYGESFIFERTLPFRKRHNYVASPPQPDDADKPNMEMRPIMVFVKLPIDVPDGGQWRLVDRLSEGGTGLPNCHVRTWDVLPGFTISCSPPHLFGNDGFWPKDAKGAFLNVSTPPRLDPRQVGATFAWRGDKRLKVVRKIDQAFETEAERRLIIEVPGAEYWYALRATVVDVEGGNLFRIHPDNRVLRDDSDILRGIAAFAQAWYQVQRQTVRITLKKVDNFAVLGSLLTTISGQYNESVNTVISSVETDFRSSTMEYQTGWGEFDVIGGMLDERRGMASRRANEFEYLGDD
jgi:hypothetical protein